MTTLPPGWAWTTLAQVADWGSGGTPKAKTANYYGGPIPWAVIGDLTDGPVSSTAQSITHEGLNRSSAKVVEGNAVLIAMYGSMGKLGLPTTAMATNQAIAFAIPGPSLVRLYLFYYLMYARKAMAAAGRGTTQMNLSQTILKAWPILVPPLAEQERIVAAIEEEFSRLDAGLTALESARRRLEQYRRSLYVSVFSRRTATIRLASVVTSSLGGAWGTADPSDPDDRQVAVIRGAEFRNWDAQRATSAPVRWVPARSVARRQLNDGDLVLEVSGGGPDQPVGRTVLVDAQALATAKHPLIPSNFCRRIELASTILPRFLWHQLQWIYESAGTIRYQKATTNIRNLTVPDFLSGSQVWVPDLGTQARVVSELDDGFRETTNAQKTCALASARGSALRSSVLGAAFAGHLVPQDPRDEPASVLSKGSLPREPSPMAMRGGPSAW